MVAPRVPNLIGATVPVLSTIESKKKHGSLSDHIDTLSNRRNRNVVARKRECRDAKEKFYYS